MKYTKGPWKIEEETTENGVAHVHIRAKPDRHPSIGPHICTINYALDFKNDLGNARLIAAAPEMFEAAESLLYRLQVCLDDLYQSGEAAFDADSEIEALDNALKKARGEI